MKCEHCGKPFEDGYVSYMYGRDRHFCSFVCLAQGGKVLYDQEVARILKRDRIRAEQNVPYRLRHKHITPSA